MEKMKYSISARTTILIGREGVSRADGAIIELIKNTYDADADFCYMCFDVQNDRLLIIDNGIGMTKNIVQNFWMLIGTDNKKHDFLSNKSRVKSGEKGIGRFALDRLGSRCTMYTKNELEPLVYWFNDWNKFEEEGKSLDEIEADFDYINKSFENVIPERIKEELNRFTEDKCIPAFSLNSGTMFIIEGLRDKWTKKDINKIFSVLGFLVPPGEQSKYYILAQESIDEKAQEIECEIIDDYDYKISAHFDGERVRAEVFRNEFDLNTMPKEIFNEPAFSVEPYTLETFNKGAFVKDVSISELMHIDDESFLNKAREVGPFQFDVVFMRLSGGEGNYYYKPVNPRRKLWMDEHGGIKIYRDNFVVRPYGDSKSKSYDWLGLDAIKGSNPVAVSDKSENWHANNSQLQGTVLISRTENLSLLDKSSREGIIENDYFDIFSNILRSIISIFEKDRAHIVHNIKKYKDKIEENNKTKEEASKIAKKVLKNKKKTSEDSEEAQLAKAIKIFEEERQELISEIKLLRALATNGLMTSTMAHDLKTINSLLVNRVTTLRMAIKDNDAKLINRNLDDLKLNDQFLKSWISVITTQSNKDRRKRSKKNIVSTIASCIKILEPILTRKKVSVEFESNGLPAIRRIFETDFDSIIYNLIINSIESFEQTKCSKRNIIINAEVSDDSICIHYNDNGHGLSDAFKSNPYDIFNYGTTSKFDPNGNQIGTGLGMYIVASTINEYNGTYYLTKIEDGFGLDITIPIK